MTSTTHRESAKIYQFPLQRRSAAAGGREPLVPANDRQAPVAYEIVSGSWYHDAAIREEKIGKR